MVVESVDDGLVVVVVAPDQALPALHPAVRVARDARPGRGPLEAIAAGLRAIAGDAEGVYVSAVDAPFLQAAFVRRLLAALTDGVDLAVPEAQGHRHPLSAAYRTALLPTIEARLGREELRLAPLLVGPGVLVLDDAALLADDALRAADPALRSLLNANDRATYDAAIAADDPR